MQNFEDDERFEELEEEFEDEEDGGDLPEEEEELDELSREFVNALIEKIIQFMEMLVGHTLHPYQMPLARRVIESVIINDGEEVTALAARHVH